MPQASEPDTAPTAPNRDRFWARLALAWVVLVFAGYCLQFRQIGAALIDRFF